MVTILEKPQDPPAYSEFDDSFADVATATATSYSVSSRDGPPSPPPPSTTRRHPSATNYLTIFHNNNSIRGTYFIDPSLPVPPAGGVGPTSRRNNEDVGGGGSGSPPNLRVGSKNGSIDAFVELVRSGVAKGPARLEVGSQNGDVSVAVGDEQLNRFRLRATSMNGSITVFIPRTFLGTLSLRLRNGTLTFSPALQAGLTTFSEHRSERWYFLGDHVESGYEGDETWLGDHVRVEATNGSVRIKFVDERAASVAGAGGLFGRWFT